MPSNKPLDITLDSLLWVSGTAFAFSLVSHLLRAPQGAFIAGVLAGVGLVALAIVAKFHPSLRVGIAYRLAQVIAGVALGVL